MRRFLALMLLVPALASAAPVLRAVPLKHRLADDVATLIRPLAPTGTSVLAADGQILLRGEERDVAMLAKAIAKLDVAQKRLRVTVRQGEFAERRSDGAGIGGTVRQPEIRAYSTEDRDRPELSQQVQVAEGQWARIDVGSSFPVIQQSTTIGPRGTVVQHSTEYKDVSSGFEVLPRVSGDDVTVEVRAFRGGLSRQGGGAIDNARVETTLRGKLGQWLDMGGATEQVQRDGRGTVYMTESRTQRQGRVQIRVDLVE